MAKVDRLYQEIHLWDYFRFSYLVMFRSITKVDSGIFWTVERHISKLRNQRKPNRSAIESLRLTRWAYHFRGIYRKFRKDFYEIEESVFSSIAYEMILEFVTKAILVEVFILLQSNAFYDEYYEEYCKEWSVFWFTVGRKLIRFYGNELCHEVCKFII